jgi:tungstate transport system ATP-binding protein
LDINQWGLHDYQDNLGQAKRMADEIVFIDRGRIVEQTPVTQFFNLPQTDAAQRFLQEETP